VPQVRVVVVDSGVVADHPHVGGVAGGLAILPGGLESEDFVDRLGHGTAVAAAILEKAPGAEIVAVRVFDRRLSTDVESLVRAIDRAADLGATLINLSLGTPIVEHAGALREAVVRARSRGAVVVSPAAHQTSRWWPGALDETLGVVLDWDCPRETYRLVRSGTSRVLVAASGYPRPIPGVPLERNLKGISFAAANVTGMLARALGAPTPLEADDDLLTLLSSLRR